MKVIFDLNYREAAHILHCLRVGQAMVAITNANLAGLNSHVIDDLQTVVEKLYVMDPTVGFTEPRVREWTTQIYLEESDEQKSK